MTSASVTLISEPLDKWPSLEVDASWAFWASTQVGQSIVRAAGSARERACRGRVSKG